MTTLWTSADLEKAVNGKASAPFEATGVSIDTRSLQKGDLFIAISGPTHDGHAFANDAFAKGAAAVMVHKDADYSGPTIRVSDTMKALEALGCAGRNRATKARIIGITGSVGKTGTKEMLAHILSDQDDTHVSPGSYNNHWGVPLTLSKLPQNAVYAVQEMGMNHAGELSVLTSFTKPDVAVITTVGPAHLEFFDDIEAIVKAKCEIFQGLKQDGTAVLNRDHPYFGTMEKAAKAAGAGNIITFGTDEGSDLRLISARVIADRTEVEAQIGGQDISYSLPFLGEHWAMNSLAALGAAIAVKADPVQALCTLEKIKVPAGRGEVSRIVTPEGDMMLIDESYNANPQSTEAAIETLATISHVRQVYGTGRAIAILGDMLELGATTKALHQGLADILINKSIDKVYTCGELMGLCYDALPESMRGAKTEESQAMIPILAETLRPGDILMVKGSKSMRMDKIVTAMQTPETFNKTKTEASGE